MDNNWISTVQFQCKINAHVSLCVRPARVTAYNCWCFVFFVCAIPCWSQRVVVAFHIQQTPIILESGVRIQCVLAHEYSQMNQVRKLPQYDEMMVVCVSLGVKHISKFLNILKLSRNSITLARSLSPRTYSIQFRFHTRPYGDKEWRWIKI